MKIEETTNSLLLNILDGILRRADNLNELGQYLTSQVYKLIECQQIALILHDKENNKPIHSILSVYPDNKQTDNTSEFWQKLAVLSHEFHNLTVIEHKADGTKTEKYLFEFGGSHSILIPLENLRKRVGLLCIINMVRPADLKVNQEQLNFLSGILATVIRNTLFTQNLEALVEERNIELSMNEMRFRKIIEQATDAMCISDLDGNIIDVNKRMCESLGYTEHELLKMKVSDVDALFIDKEKIKESFRKMELNETTTFETVHRTKDGRTFPVEIKSGKIELNNKHYIIGFIRDITERKLNEQKIIEVSRHYQALIEKAPDGIVLIDIEGRFKYVSPSSLRIFGYTEEDVAGKHPSDLTHPDDLPMVLQLLNALIQNPVIVPTIQYRFASRNGNWIWVESTFTNQLADPSVQAIVINFRDITDRKNTDEQIKRLNEELEKKVNERTIELEISKKELLENEAALLNLVEDLNLKTDELQKSAQQLEAANKELEAFSYTVSHDLRAPLRAISGFVRILLEDYDEMLDSEGKRICNIINNNAMRMGQLIDDLLSFSRLIRSELHTTKIDMNQVVAEILADFVNSQGFDGKIVSVNQLPAAKGDTNMIKQVWTNLISNAIKYSSKKDNPEIEINSYRDDYQVIYTIKDNGVGFNMEYSHKLFGVFQRLHSNAEFEGTGVGLAIVQRIVNRHGGKIWAESEPYKGATFFFSLPE